MQCYVLDMLWKAPEILRDPHAPIEGTFKADVYAFAIILHEIIGRRGPFGACVFDEPSGTSEFYSMGWSFTDALQL